MLRAKNQSTIFDIFDIYKDIIRNPQHRFSNEASKLWFIRLSSSESWAQPLILWTEAFCQIN